MQSEHILILVLDNSISLEPTFYQLERDYIHFTDEEIGSKIKEFEIIIYILKLKEPHGMLKCFLYWGCSLGSLYCEID